MVSSYIFMALEKIRMLQVMVLGRQEWMETEEMKAVMTAAEEQAEKAMMAAVGQAAKAAPAVAKKETAAAAVMEIPAEEEKEIGAVLQAVEALKDQARYPEGRRRRTGWFLGVSGELLPSQCCRQPTPL